MSCEANAKPDSVRLNAPRSASAIASNVDSQSPPQCLTLDLVDLMPGEPAYPYHRESLAAGVARPGEHDGLSYSEALLQDVEDEFVVNHRVRIVDAHWVRTIVECNVRVGNALAEVGLCK